MITVWREKPLAVELVTIMWEKTLRDRLPAHCPIVFTDGTVAWIRILHPRDAAWLA